jgi:hypothetical protein
MFSPEKFFGRWCLPSVKAYDTYIHILTYLKGLKVDLTYLSGYRGGSCGSELQPTSTNPTPPDLNPANSLSLSREIEANEPSFHYNALVIK